jgi:hypothetical protein
VGARHHRPPRRSDGGRGRARRIPPGARRARTVRRVAHAGLLQRRFDVRACDRPRPARDRGLPGNHGRIPRPAGEQRRGRDRDRGDERGRRLRLPRQHELGAGRARRGTEDDVRRGVGRRGRRLAIRVECRIAGGARGARVGHRLPIFRYLGEYPSRRNPRRSTRAIERVLSGWTLASTRAVSVCRTRVAAPIRPSNIYPRP